MELSSSSFKNNETIPSVYAFCVQDPENHVTLAENRNPQLQWDQAPAATRSFIVICHDPDVPSRPDDVNQEGRTVPADLPRVDFFHWVLVDIPADVTGLQEGAHSEQVTVRGKPGPGTAIGAARHGINDYTNWFAGDADMEGQYFGYDGPCPPWNDSIAHRYVFTVYALDIDTCPVEGTFTGTAVRQAIAGHILAEASLTGRYSLNPGIEL